MIGYIVIEGRYHIYMGPSGVEAEYSALVCNYIYMAYVSISGTVISAGKA